MLTLMIAAGISRAAIDCRTFAAQAARPVQFQVERLPVDRIAFDAVPIPKDHPWSAQHYQVGRLIYQGSGYAYRSPDQRFPAVRAAIIDPARTICGFAIDLPAGDDAATDGDIHLGQVTPTPLAATAEPPRGPAAAAAAGARPMLARHVLVASDPVYRAGTQMLLALMRPAGRGAPATTLVVASGLARGAMPAVVIARLRGDYRKISSAPNLHGTDLGIGVVGVDQGGGLNDVSFRLPGLVLDALAQQVGSPLR